MLFFAGFAQGELRRAQARLSVHAAFTIYGIRPLFDIRPQAKRPEGPKGR